MASSNGLFIVLEGSDGAGKTTQFNLLKERLKATGYEVAVFAFPRYAEPSSYFIRRYLAGAYGPATSLSPYTASLFYALDRYEAAKDIRDALKQGKIVLSDRFTGSNMAHQGAKFNDSVEQRGFFVWEDNLEFQLLGIPRPDLSFFLRVPAGVSQKLVKQRAVKSGTKLDHHEADLNFLKKSLSTYDVLCQLFPKDFKAIECTRNDKLLSVPEISNLIWDQLKPLLPAEKPHPSHSVVVSLGAETKSAPRTPDGSEELKYSFAGASLLLWLALKRSVAVRLSPDSVDWAGQGYDLYLPGKLSKQLGDRYGEHIQAVAQLHGRLMEIIKRYQQSHPSDRDAAQLAELGLRLTPLSAKVDIGVSIKKADVEGLASALLTSDVIELQEAAKELYAAARQKWPDDFSGPLESKEGPVSLNNIIAKLADGRLTQSISGDETTKLLEARPRMEFDLLAETIYPYSSLSLDEIAEEVSSWPYTQKYDSLKEAASQPEVLKKIHYKMDVLSDQMILNESVTAGPLRDFQVQSFTPRYGYDMPQIIEAAGSEDYYDDIFDASLKLYSLLQSVDREDLTPYATLMGHKVRWQMNITAIELKRIVEAAPLRGSRFVEDVSEKVSETHPLLWEIMRGSKPAAEPPKRNGKSRVRASSKRRQAKRRGGRPEKT